MRDFNPRDPQRTSTMSGYRTFRVTGVSPRCCGRGWCGGVRSSRLRRPSRGWCRRLGGFDRLGTRRFRGLRRWAWWPGLSLLAGGQSGCSTTPYQQHVVSYNPERKLSLEATEASRESSQRVRKTNTPLSTASATVYSYSRSWIHASQSKKRFASSGHPSIKQMSSANW